VRRHDPELWSDPDTWIAPGPVDAVGGHPLEALDTPGHTRGHVVYLDESRGVAYTGDHLLPHTVPSSGSDPVPTRSVVSAQLDSLRRMLTRADLLVLPAHGPVGARTHERAREQIASLEGRVDRCRAALTGPSCAREVAERLPWAADRVAFHTLAPPDQRRAMVKTIAYLDHLVEIDGAHAVPGGDGVVRYHPA
jgi:glyoxylase-like metal-dependent hydrolase (beta-lactamase superfamily II)